MAGWRDSTLGERERTELPAEARAFLDCIESLVEAPVHVVSTGPDRDDAIIDRYPFD